MSTSTVPSTAAQAKVVQVRNVNKIFKRDAFEVKALDDVSIEIGAGEFLALMGPSGSGKTTLLNMIAGIDRPTSGELLVMQQDVFRLSDAQAARWRNEHIGYVFQTFNLLAPFTALENVMLAMRFANTIPRRGQRQRAVALLSQLGLKTRLSHRPAQLSRGEQQRVAMARALANDPPVLLADEPCASLDAATAQVVLMALYNICRERATTVLIVAHDTTALVGASQVLDMREINRATGQADGVEGA